MYHGIIDGRAMACPAAPPRPAVPAFALGPVTVHRAGEGALVEASAERGGTLRLLIQASGDGALRRGDRHIALREGQWQVHDPAAWSVVGGEDAEQILIAFPRDALSARLTGLLHAAPPAAHPLDGAMRMALDVARSGLTHAAHLDRVVAAALGETLLELIRLALIHAAGARRPTPMRETVRTRIEALVQRNLVDHRLSIDMIAERMKCTKRYLHKVWSEDGQTLSQYIWEQRLERCRADLAQPDLAGRSITEIAFGWGFSNAAHFSRSFRSRYGCAPRAYRLAHAHWEA